MGMNGDLGSIRYFVHVATANSFVRGAHRAHVSPPAVSKAIRKLEEDLGVQLFERTTRRVVLTQAGYTALERCRRLLAELDALEADLSAVAATPSGPLRVAAMEVFSIALLPRALADLLRDHPAIEPACYEMIPQLMSQRLIAGELDVAFTIGATRLSTSSARGLERHALGQSRGVVVCGRKHPLYSKARITRKDLESHPFVVPKFFGAEHLPSLDQFPDHLTRRIGATIELLQMGIALVADSLYLGYFPEISVRQGMASKQLRALGGVAEAEPFQLDALTRSGSLRPATAELIRRVKSAVASATP